MSDEEDAFYAHDEGDYLLHPKWRAMISRATNRVPRRIQRYCVIYLVFAVLFLISWPIYLGPQYNIYKKELADMDNQPDASFGKNVRPEFKGMVHIWDLDAKYLPKGEGRLVAVGDVHGCREELEKLLNKVQFKEGADHLILTGDIVAKGELLSNIVPVCEADRAGPDSLGVVELARKLGASCVRGNHEDKVLLSLAETSERHEPTIPGPDESPSRKPDFIEEESFSHGDMELRNFAKTFSAEQISWLQSCPVILRVGQIGDLGSVVVVHAGLVPDIPLEKQDPFQVMNMRTIDLKTRVPSEKRDGTPWEKFWNHQQKKKPAHERSTVIYGHDRKRGKNIQSYSMGLDSGCVSGGSLTAMVIEEGGRHRYVSVGCKAHVV